MNQLVTGQMGRYNLMGRMGHGSVALEPLHIENCLRGIARGIRCKMSTYRDKPVFLSQTKDYKR